MNNTTYKFRDFDATDLRPMTKVVQAIGLKNLAAVFTKQYGGADVEEIGMEAFFAALDVLFDSVDRIRDNLDALIMRVCVSDNAEEIPGLPLDKYIAVLESVVCDTNFRDCFTAAANFYKRMKK